jgi:hypothetical protein
MGDIKKIQRKLSEGISGWLLFEFNCFRGYLFNEKYLSYPVGQILNSITEYKTLTEINHPCANTGRGRPLQVDFVLETHATWKFAFESKWIGNSIVPLGAFIWDLIRLQNLDIYHPGIRCCFILAGFEKKIQVFLEDFDLTYDKNSIKKNEIAEVNPTFLRFNLFKLDQPTKDYINDKMQKYPNFKVYSKIQCYTAHKFPKNDIINMTFSTYTFEIQKPEPTHIIHKL